MLLKEIRIDGGTQVRKSLNQDVVNDYAQQMQDGAVFPPVVVFNIGSDLLLADGFHRYFATRQNGMVEIEVEVRQGTIDDAILYAITSACKRGLTFNKEDLKEIVGRIIKHPTWRNWSTRKVADVVGRSAMTVSRVRSSLEEAPKLVSYTRKGVQTVMDTSSIGKAPRAPKKKQEPLEPENEIPEELLDEITKLSEENERLKDSIAIGQFDGSEIEKVDIEDTIKDLREQIRVKDIEIQALKESRDMFQNENAELKKTVKSLQAKLKKVEG
jgi:hypothetical protein